MTLSTYISHIILPYLISQAEERAKLEAARDKMVRDMKSKGIDERYFGELTSLYIGRIF